jgi:hypothetical protein
MARGDAARRRGFDATVGPRRPGRKLWLERRDALQCLVPRLPSVFVDVLSFERRDPHDSTWMAYAQFVRTFLLPLLANRDLGWPLEQTLSSRRDGLEPEAVYRSAGVLRRLARPYLEVVSLPTWLAARGRVEASLYRPKPAASQEQACYILRNLLNSCRRQLDAARTAFRPQVHLEPVLGWQVLVFAPAVRGKGNFCAGSAEVGSSRYGAGRGRHMRVTSV